jgi:hypothetical protein
MGKVQNSINRIGNVLHAALFPKRHAEEEYLRAIYYNRDGGLRKDQWYQLLNENCDRVGFAFSCVCGWYVQLIDSRLWYSGHDCPRCSHHFDLLSFCKIDHKLAAPEKWQAVFDSLPARPRISPNRTPNIIDTWGRLGDVAESAFEWGGDPASASRSIDGGLF